MNTTAIWTTAITGVTAIGVAALAPMVAARLTRRQWQRDQKARAYAHLTSVHRVLLVTGPAQYDDGSPVQAEMATLNTQQILELQAALGEVDLLCTDEIRVLIDEFGAVAFDLTRTSNAALQPAWDRLIDAMRADLGTK
jgi:hypothetical protein